MAIEGGGPQRDYEEALRSLGQVFDEQQLQDVMLVERESGFMVTALRLVDQRLLEQEAGRRFEFVEALYADGQIVQASMRGAELRGTRHRADRNELAFRLIGRHVNEESGSRILIVDQGDGFLLRMLVEADSDMPHRFVTISSQDLERMQEEAVAARGGPSQIR